MYIAPLMRVTLSPCRAVEYQTANQCGIGDRFHKTLRFPLRGHGLSFEPHAPASFDVCKVIPDSSPSHVLMGYNVSSVLLYYDQDVGKSIPHMPFPGAPRRPLPGLCLPIAPKLNQPHA